MSCAQEKKNKQQEIENGTLLVITVYRMRIVYRGNTLASSSFEKHMDGKHTPSPAIRVCVFKSI